MTADITRADLEAQNTRATRVAFVVAGACGDFAVQPLAPVPAWLTLLTLFVVVGAASVGQPFNSPTSLSGVRAPWRAWPLRQLVAVVVIGLAGVEALTQLRPGDVQSEGQTLAMLMLFVQFAHALAARTRRETGLGCGVVVATLAVAAVFGGDVTLVAPMTLAIAGVGVTAALLQRGALLESATAVSAGGARAAVRGCAAPLAIALAVGALLFMVLPDTPRLRPHASLNAAGRFAAGERGVFGVGAVGGNTLDLNTRGKLSDAPVLEVDASAPQYWQGAVFSDFDGRSWHASRPGLAPLWANVDGALRPTGVARPFGQVGTDTATVLASGGLDVVLAPGTPTGYAGPGTVISDLDGNARFIDDRPGARASYTVASVAATAADDALRAAAGADPGDTRWTAVPGAIAPRVRALAASLAAPTANRFDTVEAIENYLKTTQIYDVDAPLPKGGDDPVDDFLFTSHRGFCEQFATAAVVMLRSVGVPARLVTGYAFGDTASQPGTRIFRQQDAHAWVQVYYPGVGWVDSDATPPGAASAAASSGSSSVRAQVADALQTAWKRVPHGRVGAFVAVCVALMMGLAVSALVGRRMVRRRRIARAAGSADDGPVLAAYLRLERALAAQQRARAPGETFGEFARRLGGLVVGAGDVARAMRALERECYAGDGRRPSPDDVAAALAVFDRLRAAVNDDVPVVVGAAGGAGGSDRGVGRR